MNAARQILRRFDRATGARACSAADYSITATISVVPDPLISDPLISMNIFGYGLILCKHEITNKQL